MILYAQTTWSEHWDNLGKLVFDRDNRTPFRVSSGLSTFDAQISHHGIEPQEMRSPKAWDATMTWSEVLFAVGKNVTVMLMRTDFCVPCDTVLTIAEAECGEDLESMKWRFLISLTILSFDDIARSTLEGFSIFLEWWLHSNRYKDLNLSQKLLAVACAIYHHQINFVEVNLNTARKPPRTCMEVDGCGNRVVYQPLAFQVQALPA